MRKQAVEPDEVDIIGMSALDEAIRNGETVPLPKRYANVHNENAKNPRSRA
jgi:hypothetical protein